MDYLYDGRAPKDTSEGFSPQRKFQLVESAVTRLLTPGQEVDYGTSRALSDMGVLLVGNNRLRPDQLQLRGIDYQMAGGVVMPGKSAVFDFLGVPNNSYRIDKKEKDIVTQRTVGKSSDRHDGIYFAHVPSIEAAGFKVYYAPVTTNGLHLRIVYQPYTRMSFPSFDIPPIPEQALSDLASSWTKLREV